jgi:hypothetical protein
VSAKHSFIKLIVILINWLGNAEHQKINQILEDGDIEESVSASTVSDMPFKKEY